MSGPSTSTANRRILVVDDNQAIHQDFRKILCAPPATAALDAMEAALFGGVAAPSADAGFEVDSAHQGEEGVARVKAAMAEGRPYALAFVDIRMPPGIDGVETALRLWKEDEDLQVVLCSAYSDYSWEEMTQRLGVSQRLLILRKPFDNIEVRQLAHALTEKWALLRQSHRRMEDLTREVQEWTQELAIANDRLRKEMEDRAKLEVRLVQAQRLEALGRLTAGLAHEINNPLSVIMASVGFMRSELEEHTKGGRSLDSSELSEVCSDALIGAERILRIVNDFRLFSRLDSEPQKLVDLREVLDHALSGASYNLGKAQVVRDFQDVPPVWGSEQGLEQVFMGLLNNAGYATKGGEDPRVSVIARQREEGWVMVEVRDNGVGIAPEHLGRIFDPFFTTKPPGTGTGLGLSICYGIVSGLGGAIEVDSTPGKGSTFRVKLPRAPENAAAL
ncbi:hybrid sensor histidine kinase/response regulator [Melittangium boletus]|uniref:histidine kinase n=1 Tax=Melittangium boletus DSM 14713 TaxID=1294270 RepID=A0A250IFX0_9BACT|nr:ATP-binding protein [Melittangium boletus]ATB30072.1 hybrid sensor histidine kinase/response regulator [Melittangium boletus DSM 14713]